MSLIAIAAAMAVTPSQLEELLAGSVPIGVAGRLGTTARSLEEFLAGGTSIALAGRIGCTPDTLQELRNRLSPDAARAFLIGLCVHLRR